MNFFKKIIRSDFVKKIICKLIYYYIKFLLCSSKVRIIFKDFNFKDYEYLQSIYATWHGRVMFMPIINPTKIKSCAIVSDHNDGRLIGGVIEQAGIKLIFGSSNRKRIAALKEILDNISQGYNFLITPDGPRGPAKKVDGAIINIASSTGLPIIPASCSCSRAKIFNSWDNFMFGLPFGKIVIVFNRPIHVPKNITTKEKESYFKTLEDRLNQATEMADNLCQLKIN